MDIYITLDYELFLNDLTGDVDNCLITPTNKLCTILNKHNIKATFYIDMAYIYRIYELRDRYHNLAEDYLKVTRQVKELYNNGQQIGLHLHPQWFFSKYDGTQWIVDFEHYKLSDMPEQDACSMFKACKIMLEQITGGKICSFRAGGYSIQTFHPFADLLQETGIKSDSSVLYKEKNLSRLHYYDYTDVPSSDSYTFNSDVTKAVEQGTLIEYPISTSRFNYLTYCLARMQMQKMDDNSNWGNGGDLPSRHRHAFVRNIFNKMIKAINMPASIDYQSFIFCDKVFKRYIKSRKKNLVIIGHPKNFSCASMKMLDAFIEKNKEKHHFLTI